MSLLPPESDRIVEHAGVKCYVRPGSADELIFRENIVQSEVTKHLALEAGSKWLDLGGFIGTFALSVLRMGGSVVSVEANPDSAVQYRKNISLNGFDQPLLIEKAVLANPSSSIVDMHLATRYPGKIRAGGKEATGVTNHAVNTLYSRWKRPHPTLQVPTISFAEVCAEAVTQLGSEGSWSIKMDMEGSEVDILEQCDLSLFNQMFFEYHYQAGGGPSRAHAVFKKLEAAGWHLKLNHPPVEGNVVPWFKTYHLGWATRCAA